MFKLDSLELFGFKSFADKTQLVFTDQITALVGPNGCGKSNLSDAIGWVLGTHRARNVRGQKMEDLIFAGSRKRKPSGVAEVRLRLRRLGSTPLRLNGEEITDDFLEISRKVYRSGESFYLVNQRRCRLMDIQHFLDEAGLGFASYAMIAQGKIDSFLTAKPLERRAIIEEAAQITGYKSKRRSAELKLEMAQQNLTRVSDIVTEVARQLRSLKRQAAKARRYRRLKDEYRESQRQRFALESMRLQQDLQVSSKSLQALHGEEQLLSEKLKACEEDSAGATARKEELEQQLLQLRQGKSELLLKVDRTANLIGYQKEQLTQTSSYLEGNAAEQKSLQAHLREIDSELLRFEWEQSQLDQQAGLCQEEVHKQEGVVEGYREEVESAEQQLEDLRAQLLQLSADSASLHNLSEQLELRLRGMLANHERLEREKAQHVLERQQIAKQLDSQRNDLRQQEEQLAVLQRKFEERQGARRQLEKQVDECKEAVDDLQRQLITLTERLQSLQEIEVRHSQYSQGVQKVLSHFARSKNLRTAGTLADSIETRPEFERLVEEFLDGELEYILVDSLDEAMGGLAELKLMDSGRCTFLTLHSSNGFGTKWSPDSEAPPAGEGVYGRLVDVLEMQPQVEKAFHRVLPQRAEAVVVSDMSQALNLAHSYPERTFVTLEGEALTPRGLLSATSKNTRKLGLLGLKRQKRELEKKIASRQTLAKQAQTTLQEKKKALAAVTVRLEQDQIELYQQDKELMSLTHQQRQREVEFERQERALRIIEEELERLSQEEKDLRERQIDVEARLRQKRSDRSDTEARLTASQSELLQLRAEYGRAQEQLNRIVSDHKVTQERASSLGRTLERVQQQRSSARARLEGAKKLQQQSQQRTEELTSSLEDLQRQLSDQSQQAEALEGKLKKCQLEFEGWKEKTHKLGGLLRQLREERLAVQEARSGVEVDRARQEAQLQSIESQCLDQLRMSLAEACTEVSLEGLDVNVVRQRYERLQNQLEGFGPINMTALEEYQENEQRYQFLTRQQADIEASIKDTTQAIQEINRRSRRQFGEAFEAINQHFQDVFSQLFGGGECGMQLLDPEDILECGVDVYAQPPGKKLQNVMLLSGGEKAMTVFALLVAIFMYRPTQFCVLDEVDAPLDDANVGRFTKLVQGMSKVTQFIVITHNKRTMEKADCLYGVTMEEPGVSQILSVQFADPQPEEEPAAVNEQTPQLVS